jgi:catechol 2,3-dioxygenase-like lactoylglutathione lyase family enzyme
MGIGLSQIGQIAINVQDVNRATEFYRDYRDKLGMKHLFSAGTLSFFDCGGVRLMLSPPEKAEFNHPSSIIYFKVEGIQERYEELQARGVRFEDKPHVVAPMPTYDLWMTFLRDSENNLLGLMSEVAK